MLYNKSGLILFVIRFPKRLAKYLLNRVSTYYWRFFLKSVGSNVLIEWGVNFEYPKSVIIGNDVYIGKNSYFGSELSSGKLEIGDNVHIGYNNVIDHTGVVKIMAGVLTSANVKIFSHTHGINPRSKPQPRDLVIDKNVWIGVEAILLESTKKISEGSIIGAGSIVSKVCDQAEAIYAGVPAKFIRLK